ncbi:hypothetical protein KSC_067010 [Ktedonobacter sp. SOSP1-52]|nr:hypothetical protein KSC_067010 [Ktedonobacter sp. SOSP1-52]
MIISHLYTPIKQSPKLVIVSKPFYNANMLPLISDEREHVYIKNLRFGLGASEIKGPLTHMHIAY